MRKKSNILKELGVAVPRIILAVFIGIVVATPLELKLFESEINAEIGLMQQESYKLQDDLLKKRYEGDIAVIQKEINTLRSQLDKSGQERTAKTNEALAEADGTGGSRIRAMGNIYKAKAKAAEKADQDYQLMLSSVQPKLDEQYQKLNEIEISKKSDMDNLSRTSLTGFASRLKAMHRLSDREDAIWAASFFITLLFLIIECAPILVKLISEKTPYDQRLNTLETEYYLANLKQNTLSKLATDSQLTFENQTAGFRVATIIEAENEVLAHAIRQEKENIMRKNEGWFTLMKKRRIFDI